MKVAPSSTIEYLDAHGRRRAGNGVFLLSGGFDLSIQNIPFIAHQHASMLSQTMAETTSYPLVYAVISPFVAPSFGMTDNGRPLIIDGYYDEIESQLDVLGSENVDGEVSVEKGAIDTAKAVIEYVKSERFTPPLVSRLDEETVLMLWAVGELKYAVTVTDGEIGYVIRRPGETLRRNSGLEVKAFNLLMLE